MSAYDEIMQKYAVDSDASVPSNTMQNILEFTPSEFVEVFNQSVDLAFGLVHIEGELTNFKIAKGKWVYFDLKDEGASLKCFGTIYMLPGPLEDGMLVKLTCSPRLHPQFNFSLQVQSITPSGQGSLVKASQLLRLKLEKEGLFDQARKRSIPYPPETIALVASRESAAYADFVKILGVRWPMAQIIHYETQVQGEAAPVQLVEAIRRVNDESLLADVLVITRGGGSVDDLAAFSDERVVRAVAGSRVPTMAAIGHEIDESLVELASDARASTPSNAAELLVPDRAAELARLKSETAQLHSYLRSLTAHLRREIQEKQVRFIYLIEQLFNVEMHYLAAKKQLLFALSPEQVLKRGYSLVRKDTRIITHASSLHTGDIVTLQFRDSMRQAKVID